MVDVIEAREDVAAYRAVMNEHGHVRMYTPAHHVDIAKEISFDIKDPYTTSLDAFSAGLLGGILTSLFAQAKRKHMLLEDVEGTIALHISNPLALLGVIGYDEPARISQAQITIYAYSDCDEEAFSASMHEMLQKSIVYTSVCAAFPIQVRFQLVL